MKGHMFVKRLNKEGNYKSELDWDKCCQDKGNPKGYFKMFIQPIEGEIKYMRTKGGYIVSGEAYIVTNRSEKYIDKEFRDRFSDEWEGLVQTEVSTEDELW